MAVSFLGNRMVRIEESVPLATMTTFQVGGPARCFASARDERELVEALSYAQERRLSVFVLGGGSNILFSDKGFDGLVVKVDDARIEADGNRLTVGAGARLMDVVCFARDRSLSGIENLAGIPGSVGGAVRGNAGAFGAEIGSVVAEVRALDRNALEARVYSKEECAFAYRNSLFKARPELLVLSAVLELKPGNRDELAAIVEKTVAARESKHPQDVRCAGSFFMNPVVKDEELRREFERDSGLACKDDKLPAGWLIDHAGLRGKKVGGAMVSEIHPNYVLNVGGATAEDILILSSLVKQKVRTELGVQLREEVQMVGF
jgi:UDP-N-acetylmuramate dehydrogenase